MKWRIIVSVPQEANAPHVKRRAAVLAFLQGKGAVSFDEVRAGLGLDHKALPDGAIHQIAIDAGLRVERE